MASERYIALPGSERQPVSGATKTGSCNPNDQVQVTVVLRRRPSSQKLPSPAELSARGERLTRDEFEARYGADPKDIQRVEKFAQSHGLTVSQVNAAAATVVLSGT